MDMKNKLQFIFEGSCVERYHTRVGIKPDTDGRHSHGVLMFVSLLAGVDGTGHTYASATLLMAAATHDLAEQVVSDVSTPAKRLLNIQDQLNDFENQYLSQYELNYVQHLTPGERKLLKMADTFDGLLYCCRELAYGNKFASLVWRRYLSYVHQEYGQECENLPPLAYRVYEAIIEIHKEAISEEGPNYDCFTA